MGNPFYLRNNHIHKQLKYKRQEGYMNAIERIVQRYYDVNLSYLELKTRYQRILDTIQVQFPDSQFSHQDFEVLVLNDHLIYGCL